MGCSNQQSSIFDYASLEQSLTVWAATQPAVVALVVVGSRARADYPADVWSDLDLIVFTTDAAAYAATVDWLTAHGDTWLVTQGHTGRGDAEWLVLLSGGYKVDCVIAPVPTEGGAWTAQQVLAESPYQFVYERGVRILYARNCSSGEAMAYAAPRTPATHPSETEFYAAVDGALFTATRAIKFLARGDLWRAKQLCDGDLKQRLLAMLEWHARALHGLGRDTWHDGRYIEEWADPRAVAALPQTFGAYERADLRRALNATLELFNTTAEETAQSLGFAYPSTGQVQTLTWLTAQLTVSK